MITALAIPIPTLTTTPTSKLFPGARFISRPLTYPPGMALTTTPTPTAAPITMMATVARPTLPPTDTASRTRVEAALPTKAPEPARVAARSSERDQRHLA